MRTASDVVRVVAVGINLVPDLSRFTQKLVTHGKQRHGIPDATLDVCALVVVWEVVAVRHDVVIGTWVGDTAAEFSDCNAYRQQL